jgi:hypothetical protein
MASFHTIEKKKCIKPTNTPPSDEAAPEAIHSKASGAVELPTINRRQGVIK